MYESLPPAEVVEIPARTTDVRIFGGRGLLLGWSLAETAGAVASCTLRDGNGATAPIIARRAFLANESISDTFAPAGLRIHRGVFLDMLAGSLEGALYIILADDMTEDQRAAIWPRR